MSTTTTHRAALIALLAATLALSLAAAGDGVLPGDVRLTRWLQANPIPLAGSLTGVTNDYVTGLPLSVAGHALAALLLLRRRPGPALLITLATWLRLTNGLLKLAVDSPRPTPDLVAVTEQATGLGFPSGHAMGAALLLGAAAYLLACPSLARSAAKHSYVLPAHRGRGATRGTSPLPGGEGPGVRVPATSPATIVRRAAALACLAVILLTGYGRVLVGAHWPSDVLGGYLWGGLLLTLALRLVLRRGRAERPGPPAITA